jgi:hypothetical protein
VPGRRASHGETQLAAPSSKQLGSVLVVLAAFALLAPRTQDK